MHLAAVYRRAKFCDDTTTFTNIKADIFKTPLPHRLEAKNHISVGYNGVGRRTPPHSAYSELVCRGLGGLLPVRSIAGRPGPANVAEDFSPPLCCYGPLHGISGHFPHPSNYSQSINSTSSLQRKCQIKCKSTPTYEVQRFQQSAVVFPHFHGILHFWSPKWRLKLLPVPVLTSKIDLTHPVSY